MPTVDEVVRDPEFQNLPFQERHKVLATIDPDYAALHPTEQARALNGLKQQPFWQGGHIDQGNKQPFSIGLGTQLFTNPLQTYGKIAVGGLQKLIPGKQGYEDLADQAYAAVNNNKKAIARFGIEAGAQTLGALGGGTLGALGGPVGAAAGGIAGAGAGYAGGRRLADFALGESQAPNTLSSIAGDVAVGGALQAVGGALSKGVMKAIPQSVIDKMYASSLKLSTSPSVLPIAARNDIIKTGLKERAVPNVRGYEKILEKIDDFNSQVEGLIATGASQGETISAKEVAKRLSELTLKGRRIRKVDPGFYKEIRKVRKDFLEGSDAIPIARAQEMKKHIYKVYKDYYGIDDKTEAIVQGKKAIARGLKEEMEILHPEIKNLNMKEGELLNFLDPFGRAVARIQNRDIIGLGMQIAPMTAGGLAPGSNVAGKVGFASKLLDTPSIKARLAILLNKAKLKRPGMARQMVGRAFPAATIGAKNYLSPTEAGMMLYDEEGR